MRSVTAALLIFNFVFAPYTHADSRGNGTQASPSAPAANNPISASQPIETPAQLVVQTPIGEKQATIVFSETSESTLEQTTKLFEDPKLANTDILLSTDQPAVMNSALAATSSPKEKRLLRILPLARLANAQEKMASGFRSYYNNAKETLRGDKIGLTVLIITVGIDTMVWIHATSLDIHQKTAMVMMNLVMAGTFGLDRELWGKINKPLKNKLINTFDRFIPEGKAQVFKTLASQYLSNMTLGIGIQLTRTGLLSLDHFSEVVMTGSFWLTAGKLSAAITLTGFAWSELYSAVKTEDSPVAKMMLKRTGEIRGLIMAQLASISMVLQPDVYGSVPIISFVVHGSLGVIALLNIKKITNWLENNRAIKGLYKRAQTFEEMLDTTLASGQPIDTHAAVKTCRALFLR